MKADNKSIKATRTKTLSWRKSVALLFSAMLFLLFVPTAEAGSFTVTLTKNTSLVNTPGNVSGEGPWVFTVVVEAGKVSSISLNIKNNAGPGDICWHTDIRRVKGTFTFASPTMPAADFQACGNEWTDPDPGLNLQSQMNGDKSAIVTIYVTYPEPSATGGSRLEGGLWAGTALGQRNAPDLAPRRGREWVRGKGCRDYQQPHA